MQAENIGQGEELQIGQLLWKKVNHQMKKNDLIKTEDGIYRILSIEANRVLAIDGVVCSCEIIHIESDNVTKFFDFLERTCDEWENDYKVEVCDGSEWKVRMWHSSHKVKTVCGTVEYPPNGKKIEKYIRSFIVEAKGLIDPKMFGCS
jgi:hypothetical protein